MFHVGESEVENQDGILHFQVKITGGVRGGGSGRVSWNWRLSYFYLLHLEEEQGEEQE